MSIYKDLVDEFFTRYDFPVVEPFIVGLSGIDPQKKAAVLDHELLQSLLGGDSNGHFHITSEQLEWIIQQMNEKFPPEIEQGQSISGYPDEPIADYLILGKNIR